LSAVSLQVRPVRRPLALAGSIALAAAILLPSVAGAATSSVATSNGDTLNASVTGAKRTGMWRIRVVAPAGNRRVDFVVRTGDLTWSGAIRVSHRIDGRWTLVSRRSLSGDFDSLKRASGRAAGIRWSTERFTLPQNGNRRFAISVEMRRAGSYKVVGAVRNAAEAFSYGPWTALGSHTVDH
jgi:hypothetical protein